MEQSYQKTHESTDKTAQTISDTVADILDKLAGTKSEIKLSFEDLTLDTGVIKAKMTGAVLLQTIVAQQAQTTGAGEQATAYSTST